MAQWIDVEGQWTDYEHQWEPADETVSLSSIPLSITLNSVEPYSSSSIPVSPLAITLTLNPAALSASSTISVPAQTSLSITLNPAAPNLLPWDETVTPDALSLTITQQSPSTSILTPVPVNAIALSITQNSISTYVDMTPLVGLLGLNLSLLTPAVDIVDTVVTTVSLDPIGLTLSLLSASPSISCTYLDGGEEQLVITQNSVIAPDVVGVGSNSLSLTLLQPWVSWFENVSTGVLPLTISMYPVEIISERRSEWITARSYIHPSMRMESAINKVVDTRSFIHPSMYLESLTGIRETIYWQQSRGSGGLETLSLSLDLQPITVQITVIASDQTVETSLLTISMTQRAVAAQTSLVQPVSAKDILLTQYPAASISAGASIGTNPLALTTTWHPISILSDDVDFIAETNRLSITQHPVSVALGDSFSASALSLSTTLKPVTLSLSSIYPVGGPFARTITLYSPTVATTVIVGRTVKEKLKTSKLGIVQRPVTVTTATTVYPRYLPATINLHIAAALVGNAITTATQSLTITQRSATVTASGLVIPNTVSSRVTINPVVVVCDDADIPVGSFALTITKQTPTLHISTSVPVVKHSSTISIKPVSVAKGHTQSVATQTIAITTKAPGTASSCTYTTSAKSLTVKAWDVTPTVSGQRVDTTVQVAKQSIVMNVHALAAADKVAVYLESQVYPTTGPQPDTFLVSFDGAANISIPSTTLVGGSVWLHYSITGLSKGPHSARIIATNIWGWSQTSDPVTFIVV